MVPEIFLKVTGKQYRSREAILIGYERFKIIGQSYPAITLKAGACTEGIVYFDISEIHFHKLDLFEGNLYKKINSPVHMRDHQVVDAIVYVLNNGNESLLSKQKWDKNEFIQFELKKFLRTDSGFENG